MESDPGPGDDAPAFSRDQLAEAWAIGGCEPSFLEAESIAVHYPVGHADVLTFPSAVLTYTRLA